MNILFIGALDAPILILDQPTSELDPQGRYELYKRLGQLNKTQNLTVVLVMDRIEEVLNYANRVFYIRDGEIVKEYSPEEYYKDQIERRKVRCKYDTKALVGSVIIGILFVIMEQVTGRIDGILDPTLLLLNGTCWAFFTGLIVLMYKQPAGIIAGLVEAIAAMATGYSPLAFFFLFANVIGSIAYSLIARNFSMEKLSHHVLAMIGCNVTGNFCVMIGLIYAFHLDWKIALLSSCITVIVATVVASILTKSIYGALQKSSLI